LNRSRKFILGNLFFFVIGSDVFIPEIHPLRAATNPEIPGNTCQHQTEVNSGQLSDLTLKRLVALAVMGQDNVTRILKPSAHACICVMYWLPAGVAHHYEEADAILFHNADIH
jgi:hypothetical protein